MTYLFIGIITLWIGILIYMGRLYGKQKEVSRQLEDIRQNTNRMNT